MTGTIGKSLLETAGGNRGGSEQVGRQGIRIR